jgi:YVTN family beta-propeller protein
VLDTRTGKLLRTVAVGALPTAVAVDERIGAVFVANAGSHSVSVLKASTGTVRRTIEVGTAPVAVAVEAGGGRVFVANKGDDSVSILATEASR